MTANMVLPVKKMVTPKTILCCDDEREICDLIAEEMEGVGYRVLRAYSGSEAVQVLSQTKVDLILSDIHMPDGDGYWLLQQVRENNPVLPVVFMVTGYCEYSANELTQRGAQGLFHKPVDIDTLIDAVRSHLRES